MRENYCHGCGAYTEIDDVSRLCGGCYQGWLDRRVSQPGPAARH